MQTTKQKPRPPLTASSLLGQLTLEEKVACWPGRTHGTVAVERLGIPALKMSDGPNGSAATPSRAA